MAPVVSVGSLASYVTGLSRALQRKGNLVEVILPKFSYFSRASLDYIVKSGKQPDVLHIHNWQTAIIGPLFWDIFVNQGLGGTRILFSCHGFSSQCLEHPDKLALCGLDPPRLHRPDRLQDNIKTHLGGVVYSNKVMVVSAIHSKDRIIRSFSHGLESTLAIHREKLLVTPYGFDDTVWDPSKDKFLPAKYSVDDTNGKAVCKAALRKQLGFSGNGSSIVVGCIYSEVSDVDLENLKAAVWLALRKGAQDENVRFVKKYNEALSHLVLAGSDIILCPSFHDPLLQVPRNDPSRWIRKIKDGMSKDFSWDAECYDIHAAAYMSIKNL
ncbi:putative starch synthase 4, chloroplastic/amyloplastic isoform X1 [Cinnamomum micranthum f. kanehirae]|uniref:starch synthase n=1 Tax=Cinnamomum micranthum f. kanehirae TaxID=337451 RepID=A0A3S4NJ49_9MAGN|nr:putative starch synthase 4, chloroplastic/amyloplastic isoform X1 [Cinnamomum micranthum f. kanehirae]